MKVLVFIAYSNYARFRCPYTTTSALTFTTIHPVAVKGLIGAVLGIDYQNLFGYTNDIRIGIEIINKVNKDMQSFNLIAMKNNNGARNFQSRVQFLRDVKYRLSIHWDESKMRRLHDILLSREYVFTPYLGCSEHIAKLELEGLFNFEQADEGFSDTIVPKENVILDNLDEIEYFFDRIPTKNSEEREYIDYENVVFSPGNRIRVKDCPIFRGGGKNVYFF